MDPIVVTLSDGMNVVLTPVQDGTVTLSLAGRIPGPRNKYPYERVEVTLSDGDGDDLRRGIMRAQTAALHAQSLLPVGHPDRD